MTTAPRVRLRPLEKRDQEAYFAVRRSSVAFLKPWEPKASPEIDYYSEEFFDQILENGRHERREFLSVERIEDEQFLGLLSINDISRGAFQNAYLGYWIGAPYARQGYMKEALKLALERAFSYHELHRLEANIMPRNEASLALVRSTGFRFEGRSERYLRIQGVWEDHERWAITAEEWQED